MRRLALLALTTVVLGALAVPASGQTAEVPTFRTERAYFKCAEGPKLQNVAVLQGTIPTWNTTPPAGSFTAGNGCGFYENLANASGLNLEFKGTFTGNLDNLTVELHDIYASTGRPNHQILMRAVLTIDDEPVVESALMNFPTTASSTGISEKIAFTFTELNFDEELGDGTQVHNIHLVARGGTETQSLFVWDASEVPAGLTFNPATPEAFKIAVDRP
ncbi:MAG TPA: hypothetical protein VG602_07730 [Actinomycetota bacterium]|nr:hypothetical protein [Actinomycetota bacterium]